MSDDIPESELKLAYDELKQQVADLQAELADALGAVKIYCDDYNALKEEADKSAQTIADAEARGREAGIREAGEESHECCQSRILALLKDGGK